MKLSKEKKQQLALVAILTVVICGGIWYGLIGYQNRSFSEILTRVDQTTKKEFEVSKLIGRRDNIESELEASVSKLAGIEGTFADGDLYSWFILRLREFQQPYHVDTPQISREVIGDVNLLSSFPYRQATYSIRGSAFYEDLGRFIADFENRFPHFRLLNLEVNSDGGAATEGEKLSFRMDISTLIKPAPAPAE